jgi:hypothetical protein
VAFALVRQFGSATSLREQELTGLCHYLRQQGICFQQRTLDTVLAWAQSAAPPDSAAELHRQIALVYEDDRRHKNHAILLLERAIVRRLAQTPYILLLSFPGINVVSAADFAGEMGPIENYAKPRAITGRAGLFPSRYQSDRVDRARGPLVRRANRALRAVILAIADNLILCNARFRLLTAAWRAAGKDPRHSHVKIENRLPLLPHRLPHGRGRTYQYGETVHHKREGMPPPGPADSDGAQKTPLRDGRVRFTYSAVIQTTIAASLLRPIGRRSYSPFPFVVFFCMPFSSARPVRTFLKYLSQLGAIAHAFSLLSSPFSELLRIIAAKNRRASISPETTR